MENARSLTMEEWERWAGSRGEQAFRAKQVFQWLHQKRARSFEEMTNLSKTLRGKLAEEFEVGVLETVLVQKSKRDGTRKFLFGLEDGNRIESVYMPYRDWNAVCISSQAGCGMGCGFCASTIGGLKRSLTAGEMLGQVYEIAGEVPKVSSVVVMGSGEPLHNLENLLKFIQIITSPEGMNLSGRGITVSTCGIVPKIRELAEEKLPINLAVSLHAADQEKREMLMPVAREYPLDQLMDACRDYFSKTGRRLTFEYALISGINDSREDAGRLWELLHGMNCYVNLIPMNPVRESRFRGPGRQKAEEFRDLLEKRGLSAAIRREMGADIDGACGQLRARFQQ